MQTSYLIFFPWEEPGLKTCEKLSKSQYLKKLFCAHASLRILPPQTLLFPMSIDSLYWEGWPEWWPPGPVLLLGPRCQLPSRAPQQHRAWRMQAWRMHARAHAMGALDLRLFTIDDFLRDNGATPFTQVPSFHTGDSWLQHSLEDPHAMVLEYCVKSIMLWMYMCLAMRDHAWPAPHSGPCYLFWSLRKFVHCVDGLSALIFYNCVHACVLKPKTYVGCMPCW
jgi:hypothetical protein